MAPLINQLKVKGEKFDTIVCVTAQHREMLDQVLDFFDIRPDYDLDLMSPDQSLFDVTARELKGLEGVIDEVEPDLIFVQGDTTTAFIGALAGCYRKVKVAHLEAGLRSFNKYAPYPEEMNRILAGHLADLHFAPTERAKENLCREGIEDHVYVVGNTVIDALFLTLETVRVRGLKREMGGFFSKLVPDFPYSPAFLSPHSPRIILVTGHRRESFGEPFKNICLALKEIAERYHDVHVVYPVHLNPNVREPAFKILAGVDRVYLMDPIPYPQLVYLMSKAYLILTDSGGIQEEAPSLGKPVLVMREVTERVEGIEGGTARLVGTSKDKIVNEVERLLEREDEYLAMARAVNPYGDGRAAERVVEVLETLELRRKA